MTLVEPDAALRRAVAAFELPTPLTFGARTGPVLFVADYRNGQWQPGELMEFGPIPLNPAGTALQFGQQCFEGMKVFWVEQDAPAVFRLDAHIARMRRSAERLCMPAVPAELFAQGVASITAAMQPLIPRGSGDSLYLRPMLYGCDERYPVASADNFRFAIVCSPSGPYFAKPIRVLVERTASRAAVGGTGDIKAGGNYAGSILATRRCNEAGFDQPLWLDPSERKNVEELSAMNVAAIIDDELHTPALSGTILPGITRDSLLKLAANRGMGTAERVMPIDELLDDIAAGRCTEFFACGTAAILNPIAAVADGERLVELPEAGTRASELRQALLDIQEGRAADPHGWMSAASSNA